MGLLTILRKLKEKEKQIRILILGLDNAGKTTILKRVNGEDYLKTEPTLGFNIKTLQHRSYLISFWDVGGQSCIRSYWKNYFESTDGLIFVVDSVDRDRIEIARQSLAGLLQEERLLGATLLIYCNKQDIAGAMTLEQISNRLGLSTIKSHHFNVISCSAITSAGLLEGMDWIILGIIKYLRNNPKFHQMRKTVLSGIQPTGIPHLGNYIGAIQSWVKLQDEYKCIIQIADLHAITVPQNPQALRTNVREMGYALLACGIDPSKAILMRQSRVHQHAELAWVLFSRTPTNWLTRMHQVKSKSNGSSLHLGLMSYPVLQAADILLYNADYVPVGEDQEQHLNLTSMITKSFNSHYKTNLFNLPAGMYQSSQAKRIMSLKDPLTKMSKSDPVANSQISLIDSEDLIRIKIRKSTTDSIDGITYDPTNRPGVSNLINILASLEQWNINTSQIKEKIFTEFGIMKTGEFKEYVAEVVVGHVAPIRAKYLDLIRSGEDMNDIYTQGEMKASEIAKGTLSRVFDVTGL